MPSTKEWHLRASWSLDDLAQAMACHFGYADRTAFIKSMIRGAALVGRSGNHAMLIRLSHEPPAVQDKIDAEICRMWKQNESIAKEPMRRTAEKVTNTPSVTPERVLEFSAEEIIARARAGRNGVGEGG